MRNNFKLIFAVVLSFLLILSAADASVFQSEDSKMLIGNWDIELVEPAMQMEFVFMMDEDTLSGEMKFEMGSGVMEEIVFEDNKLTFLVALDAGGQVVEIEVLATVNEDEIKGTLFTEMGDVEFSGKKRKEK